MQSVKIVVWEDGDGWIGFLQEYPDYWTQGSSLEDLRAHLKDLQHESTTGNRSSRWLTRYEMSASLELFGCAMNGSRAETSTETRPLHYFDRILNDKMGRVAVPDSLLR